LRRVKRRRREGCQIEGKGGQARTPEGSRGSVVEKGKKRRLQNGHELNSKTGRGLGVNIRMMDVHQKRAGEGRGVMKNAKSWSESGTWPHK